MKITLTKLKHRNGKPARKSGRDMAQALKTGETEHRLLMQQRRRRMQGPWA